MDSDRSGLRGSVRKQSSRSGLYRIWGKTQRVMSSNGNVGMMILVGGLAVMLGVVLALNDLQQQERQRTRQSTFNRPWNRSESTKKSHCEHTLEDYREQLHALEMRLTGLTNYIRRHSLDATASNALHQLTLEIEVIAVCINHDTVRTVRSNPTVTQLARSLSTKCRTMLSDI